MVWINQVKFFYTSTITLLATFIWSVIVAVLFFQDISFQLFFLIIVMSNVGRYILRRGINPKLCLIISILPIALVEFLTSNEVFFAILNIGFSCLLILKLFKEEENGVNYDEYKSTFLHGIYYIFTAGVLYSFMRWSEVRSDGSIIYVGILAYIILAVISIREAMGYEYQIKRSKCSKCINYLLVLFGIVLTQEVVYSKLILLVKVIKNGVVYVLSWLVNIILIILKYPIGWIFSLIQKLIGDVDNELLLKLQQGMNKSETLQQESTANPIIFLILNTVFLVLKIALVILFIYLLYKAINKIYYKANESKAQGYTEFVEEIEIQKSKENKLSMKIKKLFRKKGTPREEVIYKYGELVNVAARKEFFKEYMTPGQLKNIIKIKVDSSPKIDEVTSSYNEAKFSNHKIEEYQKKIVEENVNKLNKLMK